MPFEVITPGKVQLPQKTIVQGIAEYNGSKATFAIIGGGTTTAIATRHKVKVLCSGQILGIPFINDTKTTSGNITGEGGQAAVDIVNIYGNLIYKGVAYPLYVTPDGSDRVLALDGGMMGTMYIKGAVFVRPGDFVYIQTAWYGSASTINCPRHNVIALNEDEGYLFYDSGTPATDATNAKAGADLNEWLPIVGNQQKSEMTANNIRMPAPGGLLMRVRGDQPHVAIRGTSRSIGSKNWYVDPNAHTDSFIGYECYTRFIPCVNNAVGSAIGANDEDNPAFSAKRRWMEQGATIIMDEHLQNDLANDYSLSDIQRRLVDRKIEANNQGAVLVGFTVDPWTTTSASGDWHLESTQTIADTDTSAKRTAMNDWLRRTTSTLEGGNPSISLDQCYDAVIDTALYTEGTDKTKWGNATTYDSGTATGASATTLVDSTKTWTPYALHDKYIVGLTAADAVTKALITSNAPASLAITSTTATVASWSNGTHGNKAYTIYNTLTNDGIHASYYANRLKGAAVGAYLAKTVPSFTLNSLPWTDYWIAHPQYLFQDTGCSTRCTVTNDPIQVWVGALNGLKMTGSGSTRPFYNATGTYGAVKPDGTDDFLTATTALASQTNKQHRIAVVTVFEAPDSSGGVKPIIFFSNNVGNTRLSLYNETGGGAGNAVMASSSRVDEAGTANSDNWTGTVAQGTYVVRIDYVDYQEGKQYGWINGAIKLDDATAWAASKGLSVATDSQNVFVGKNNTPVYGNFRIMFIGVIRNFEMTPYWVSTLSTYLGTVGNWMPTGF